MGKKVENTTEETEYHSFTEIVRQGLALPILVNV
jgi:hypothetical protein